MEELTGSVRQNADNATHANQLAVGASQVLQKVVSTMGKLTSCRAQWWMLSASSTSTLSTSRRISWRSTPRWRPQRSANSAREIKKLIEESGANIDGGSLLVQPAGTTMDELMSGVSSVNTLMAEIMSASCKQSMGFDQINTAITLLTAPPSRMPRWWEQVSAAAQAMEEQSVQLERAISSFKL